MLWTLLGRLAQALSQAGLLVLAARLGSAEMVGELALAMALCSPVMVIAGLQLRIVYVTDIDRRFGWRTHVRLRRWASAAGVALACLMTSSPWVPLPVVLVGAVALAKAGELSSDLHHATFQARGAMRLYARSVALRASLGLGVLATTLLLSGSLVLGLLSTALVTWGVALVHDAPHSRHLRQDRPRDDDAHVGSLLWVAAPLGLMTFVDSLAQHGVRIEVDALLGKAALGHYAAMSYAVVAGGAVVFSLGTPLLPRLAAHFAANRRAAFFQLVGQLVAGAALLGAAGVGFAALLGGPFLRLVFGADFARHADVFPWVMGAGALHFVLGALMHALNAAVQRRVQPWIYAAALSVTLVVGWTRIASHGLRGAAEAAACGWAVAVLLASWVLIRAWRSMNDNGEPA